MSPCFQEAQQSRDEVLRVRTDHDATIARLTAEHTDERTRWSTERGELDAKFKIEIEQIIKAITEERVR